MEILLDKDTISFSNDSVESRFVDTISRATTKYYININNVTDIVTDINSLAVYWYEMFFGASGWS